VFVDQFLKE
jgi:hypothetical protein